jgi:hypothetical protein
MQQMNRRQQRTSDLLCKATRAGGKLQLAQPRTATRVRPSVQPPVGHRCGGSQHHKVIVRCVLLCLQAKRLTGSGKGGCRFR